MFILFYYYLLYHTYHIFSNFKLNVVIVPRYLNKGVTSTKETLMTSHRERKEAIKPKTILHDCFKQSAFTRLFSQISGRL